AKGGELVEGPPHRVIELRFAGMRHQHVDQVHRRLPQDAGRLAALVAIDDASRWVRGGAIDGGELERGARDPRRVTILASQVRGTSAGSLVEVKAGWKGLVGPRVVVPAGSDDPRAGGQVVRPVLDPF